MKHITASSPSGTPTTKFLRIADSASAPVSRERLAPVEEYSALSFWRTQANRPESANPFGAENIQSARLIVAQADPEFTQSDAGTQGLQPPLPGTGVTATTTITTVTTTTSAPVAVIEESPETASSFGFIAGGLTAGGVGLGVLMARKTNPQADAKAVAKTVLHFLGTIWDGIASAASISIDANNNGRADTGEETGWQIDAAGHFSGSTTLTGSFFVVGTLAGGTGQNNQIVLKAPAGSSVINPLTTLLLDTMAANPSLSMALAEAKMLNGLGLTLPPGSSVATYDFKQALSLNASDPVALAAQQKAVQVIGFATAAAKAGAAQVTAGLADGSSAVANQVGNALDKLAQHLANSSAAVNLSDPALMSQLLTSAGVSSATAANAKQQIADIVASAANGLTTSGMFAAATTTATQLAPVSASLLLDTGASNSDKITNIGTLNPILPAFDLNTLTFATVEYSTNSGSTWATGFSAVEGTNTIQVRQKNGAGSTSTPTTFTFTLDTIINNPTIALANDTGSSASDKITNNATLAGVEPGATLYYWLPDTSPLGSALNNWLGPYTAFTPVQGQNRIKVSQIHDLAGNVNPSPSPSNELIFTFDSIPPASNPANFSPVDMQTGGAPVVVDTATLFTGASSITLGSAAANIMLSAAANLVTIAPGTSAGNAWITATATDTAGNVSTQDFSVAVYSSGATVTAGGTTIVNTAAQLYSGTAGNEIFDISGINTNAVIKGGAGSDIFVFNTAVLGFSQVIGGSDLSADTVRLSANFSNLDLSRFNHSGQRVLSNIEVFDLATDVGANSITLKTADLFAMGGALTDAATGATMFRIDGGTNDSVTLTGSGMTLLGSANSFAAAGLPGTGYSKYTGSFTDSSGNHLVEALIQNGMQVA
ncbi:MAG: hypothetical protein EPO42_09870 [Gallionellaceae bacterium]|nr:MAG: hypothetical protein EPO42_09870 [Gallionellaceae bacterium]